MSDKLISKTEIIKYIKNGDSILVGGFGLSGTPMTLINVLVESDLNNLTIVSNNLGEEGKGLGKLLFKNQVKKLIGSYFTTNKVAVDKYKNGEIDIELIPQGTFVERIRCAGAGIGGFYTKTGVGTKIAEGKETKVIENETYLFEKKLNGDVSLIRAFKADKLGNLIYEGNSRNFNVAMATAANMVIAEVDEIVEVGELSPNEIVTPHLYVDFIVLNDGSI